jgi:hypothetical protein
MRQRKGSITPGVHYALTTHLPGDLDLRDREGKDGERAKGTGAFKYEGTRQQISSIEAVALGPMLRAQAPKRGSHSVYPSRRWLRGSLPVVRDDRTGKGQRRRCAACAVGARGTQRAKYPHQEGTLLLFISRREGGTFSATP